MRLVLRLAVLLMVLVPMVALVQQREVAAQSGSRCFPETGFCISGRIREFWEQNGGLPVFGFPIAPQGPFVTENGRVVQAQWFERQRLELHPENARPYDVLLGRLGVDRLNQQGRDWFTFPKADPSSGNQPGCVFVAQTQHSVCEPFRTYYLSYGLEFDGRPGFSIEESLALFGLPVSQATPEIGPDGRERLTQWFERARLEFHPTNPPQFQVLGGLLGREVFDGLNAPPPAPPAPTPVPSPTPIPGPGPGGCTLEMTFEREVAVPNGTVLDPFARFDRIWRVRNDGTCTWTNFDIVFSRGDQMSGPAASRIPAAQPGQSVDITVPMIAPGRPGDYRGFWVLRASNGATFGGLIAAITVRPLPTPVPPAGNEQLAYTSWQLATLNVNQLPVPDARPTLNFLGNAVQGSTGCNTFNGSFQLSGQGIVMGPFASTRIFCGEGLSQQEFSYLQALEQARTWQRDGVNLVLFDITGREVARFTPAP
ncbi:MAG: META domain-containing protein [Oscillochloridaceae bacterium umkhey_bin13]